MMGSIKSNRPMRGIAARQFVRIFYRSFVIPILNDLFQHIGVNPCGKGIEEIAFQPLNQRTLARESAKPSSPLDVVAAFLALA